MTPFLMISSIDATSHGCVSEQSYPGEPCTCPHFAGFVYYPSDRFLKIRSHIIALPSFAVLEDVELAQVVLLGLVLQQASNVAQLEAVLGEAVHLEEALTVVKLAEERVFLSVASDASVCVIPRILALAVKLDVTLSKAGEVVV